MDTIETKTDDRLVVGLVQIAPVWLNREETLRKVLQQTQNAVEQGCQLVVFSEALLPGYPFWIERTDGARFNSPIQKGIYAHYLNQAVQIEADHLRPLCNLAEQHNVAVILGCVERPVDRGGHSLYCSLVYINPQGQIASVHRKLMPTYEERLAWSPGDGHGLRVHTLGSFTIGGLNCWENWMPLPRAALYAQGENLHVALWPGSLQLTKDITRFIAQEGRSYVLSVSGLMRKGDFPPDTPHLDRILEDCPDIIADGGTCLAGPDGEWLIQPMVNEEALLVYPLDLQRVREERQNFDPAGHYARPDVTQLTINRQRQSTLLVREDNNFSPATYKDRKDEI